MPDTMYRDVICVRSNEAILGCLLLHYFDDFRNQIIWHLLTYHPWQLEIVHAKEGSTLHVSKTVSPWNHAYPNDLFALA